MASSGDDSDFEAFPPSPDVEIRPGRSVNTRRKVHAASPEKFPKKKQKALADFNLAVDDSEEEDFDESDEEDAAEFRKKSRGGGGVGATRAKKNHGEGSGRGAKRSDETENQPPVVPAYILNADIPEESSQSVNGSSEAASRARKRLSIRRSEGSAVSDVRRSSITSGTAESLVASASEVQNIYETCSQMFNANRINPQNAFNLRLLDCINQMINSPNYDKSNMQLTSSTLEIGTKIYVCRVDNTHSQVMSLASYLTHQQRRKRKDGGGREGEDDGNQMDDGGMEHGDDGVEDEDGRRQKTKKRVVKKRGKFVEEDNAKLLTGLEEQNVKYVTRRNFLKKKFNEMVLDDLDFDYLNYFLEPEDEHPLLTPREEENLKTKKVIPDSHVNTIELTRLDYFPFNHLSKFDPENYNIWGVPLNSAEVNRAEMSQGPQFPVDEGYAYDPAERPAEYADEAVPDNMNDTLGDALPHFGDGDEGLPAVSFHNIYSLDHLDSYFKRVRGLLKDSKSKFGWCGPNFVRPKTTWGVQQKGAKKPKVRKEPEKIDCMKIDWQDEKNKFSPNVSVARTIFDDKIIEEWSTQKVIIPFLGIELNDEDFDPMDLENENDPKYVPAIFKFFVSRNRSILDLLRASERRERRISGTSMGPPSLGEDGFDQDNDLEVPRNIVDDFCSQPTNEDGYHPADGATGPESAWPFPASIPGLLNDDPLSAVSGIDSIRFSRKPKPIDMSALKKAIFKVLLDKLSLDENGNPLQDEETSINLAELMYHVLHYIGLRTEKLMSVPIFVVALMHVVADKKLFVQYYEAVDAECPLVICRGKKWNHADHIPMPEGGFEMD